jgi:probable rRNA maturation factor
MPGKFLFFTEGIGFKLRNQRFVSNWLTMVAELYGNSVDSVSYVFVSDAYLLQLNQQFLNHDTLTDIITFGDDDCPPGHLRGDIYISVDRVTENAALFQETFDTELRRVMVHGLLHMIGFLDKSEEEQGAMRLAEDKALSLWKA